MDLFQLDPWYVPGTPITTKEDVVEFPDGRSFTITRTDRVWHGGTNNWDTGGNVEIRDFVDGEIIARFKTTGDAKVRLVMDYYHGDDYTHEATLGDWVSCTSGSGQWTSTPRKDAKTDCRTTTPPSASSPSPSNPPPSNGSGCPSSGIRVTAGSSLLNGCGSGLQVVTWDGQGNELASSPGQPLTIGSVWDGFAFVTARCGTSYVSVQGSNATQAGFSQVCSGGVDVTSATPVCNSNGAKIGVALNPAEAGRCN